MIVPFAPQGPMPEHPVPASRSGQVSYVSRVAHLVGRKRVTHTVLLIRILLLLNHCCNSMKYV